MINFLGKNKKAKIAIVVSSIVLILGIISFLVIRALLSDPVSTYFRAEEKTFNTMSKKNILPSEMFNINEITENVPYNITGQISTVGNFNAILPKDATDINRNLNNFFFKDKKYTFDIREDLKKKKGVASLNLNGKKDTLLQVILSKTKSTSTLTIPTYDSGNLSYDYKKSRPSSENPSKFYLGEKVTKYSFEDVFSMLSLYIEPYNGLKSFNQATKDELTKTITDTLGKNYETLIKNTDATSKKTKNYGEHDFAGRNISFNFSGDNLYKFINSSIITLSENDTFVDKTYDMYIDFLQIETGRGNLKKKLDLKEDYRTFLRALAETKLFKNAKMDVWIGADGTIFAREIDITLTEEFEGIQFKISYLNHTDNGNNTYALNLEIPNFCTFSIDGNLYEDDVDEESPDKLNIFFAYPGNSYKINANVSHTTEPSTMMYLFEGTYTKNNEKDIPFSVMYNRTDSIADRKASQTITAEMTKSKKQIGLVAEFDYTFNVNVKIPKELTKDQLSLNEADPEDINVLTTKFNEEFYKVFAQTLQ